MSLRQVVSTNTISQRQDEVFLTESQAIDIETRKLDLEERRERLRTQKLQNDALEAELRNKARRS
jgi:hypothetical protein